MPIFNNQQRTKPGGIHVRALPSAKENGFLIVEATKAKLVVVVDN